ncbi:MAG: response regulator [Actinomycetota bacterium]
MRLFRRTAGDCHAAMDVVGSRDLDLVMLDLVMPRRDGLDVLTAVKARQSSPLVIVLTAVHEISARVQALERGAGVQLDLRRSRASRRADQCA